MFISDTIKSEIVTITPETASRLLEQNTGNRKVSKANYNLVTEAMAKGEWELNGEAIKIATDGRILDGQHRLMAAANNDLSFQTLIVYGLRGETQDTMDTGKSRSATDVLSINGYQNAQTLAAVTTGIIRDERWGLKMATSRSYSCPVTPKQVLARVEQEPSLGELVQFCLKLRSKVPISAKNAGVLFYRFSKIDVEDAEFFFDKLASGENLERGNPILTLRELLFNLATNQKGITDQSYISAVTIKAWNKFRAGTPCFVLRYSPGGAKPESFPEPI